MGSGVKAVNLGGVGSTITADDIVRVASGAPVTLDPTCLEKLKQHGSRPKNSEIASVEFGGEENDSSGDGNRECLSEAQTRAVGAVRLLTLINGGTCGRVIEGLAKLLNSRNTPPLRTGEVDKEVLNQLARILAGQSDDEGSKPEQGNDGNDGNDGDVDGAFTPVSVTENDLMVVESGCSASVGIGALAVQGGKLLLEVAGGIAGLSCEALGADLKPFDTDKMEACPHKSALDVADDLRCLLEGSQMINPKKRGVGCPPGVAEIPVEYGACRDALNAAYISVRTELTAVALSAKTMQSGGGQKIQLSPVLASNLCDVSKSLIKVGGSSLRRIGLLLGRLRELRPIVFGKPQPEKENGSGQDEGELPAAMDALEGHFEPIIGQLNEKMSELRVRVAEGVSELVLGDVPKSVKIAVQCDECVHLLEEVLYCESLLGVLSLRVQEGTPPPPVTVSQENAEISEKKAKKKKKGKGMVVGRGSGVLRSNLETQIVDSVSKLDELDDEVKCIKWPFTVDAFSHGFNGWLSNGTVFDPVGQNVGMLAGLVRAQIESNDVQRKPKIPKGTRDFLPDQMGIREVVFNKITAVFKRHGAVSIDTPVFELRETLMGKYGEDSKLIYDLADQGGEILSLRYDLTVPFARFVALHGVGNIKRYHIGKVYRRDQPQMTRGRFREFFQCDFDIAGTYATMVADSEVIKVLGEILSDLDMGEFEIKLNHRKLLDSMMAIAGVPAKKFRAICSAIDKLDKEPWECVRHEMVNEKGLAESAADTLGEFVKLRGDPIDLLATLSDSNHAFANNVESKSALEELGVLFGFLKGMNGLRGVVLDLSLARGLDYYSGVIYEAVLSGANVGSIAAGGRYDKLVGMFSGKDVPAVGVSIGIERVFAIVEAQARERAEKSGVPIRAASTQVLVSSIGNGMQQKRMEVCSSLWHAGIAAEFGYKPNPKMGDQFNYAFENGIPFMVLFGEDEVAKGIVKIKDLDKRTETEVEQANLVQELMKGLGMS